MKRLGKRLSAAWMKFAHALGYVNTRVLLILMYVIIIGPIAVVMWVFRNDPLDRAIGTQESYWRKRDPAPPTLEALRRQF